MSANNRIAAIELERAIVGNGSVFVRSKYIAGKKQLLRNLQGVSTSIPRYQAVLSSLVWPSNR